jgi:hypothetical protein
MKKILLVLFFVLISTLLFSCVSNAKSAEEILSSILSSNTSLPAGNVKILGREEYEKEYLDIALLRVMFANSEAFAEEANITELAMYLSGTDDICEIVIVKANSRSAARDIAELFARRKNELKTSPALSDSAKQTVQNTKITVSGKFVLYAVSEGCEEINRIFMSEM